MVVHIKVQNTSVKVSKIKKLDVFKPIVPAQEMYMIAWFSLPIFISIHSCIKYLKNCVTVIY